MELAKRADTVVSLGRTDKPGPQDSGNPLLRNMSRIPNSKGILSMISGIFLVKGVSLSPSGLAAISSKAVNVPNYCINFEGLLRGQIHTLGRLANKPQKLPNPGWLWELT